MSQDLWLLALKAILAGAFVVLLSFLATKVKSKLFAGLFAGAPAVASVSLTITALTKPPAAIQGSRGMIAGAAAMIACCVVAALVLPRTGALIGSLLAWFIWAVVALAVYLLFLA